MKEQIETLDKSIHDIELIKKNDWYRSHSVSANYTIVDNDKIKTLLVTTGASDITITLPTIAANLDRVIEIIKIDSGAGTITVDGEGAELINSQTTIKLISQFDKITIKSANSFWVVDDLHITYLTGWVQCNDWTNQHLGSAVGGNVIHSMETNLKHIFTKILFSTDGTENNSFQVHHSNRTLGASGLNREYGLTIFQVDTDNLIVQTGTHGVEYNDNATGASQGITNGWYYNIVLKRIIID